jgi:hypothetical protein
MYKAPILEWYGTFRELTKGGGGAPTDGFLPDTDPSTPTPGELENCVVEGGVQTCDVPS